MNRNWLGLILVAFAVTMAVVVGNRLSTEAMAVVVGVVCGVGAGLPTSAVILLLLQRLGRREMPRREMSYPPVVVIQPGQAQSRWPEYPPSYPLSLPAANAPREFKVVGEDWLQDA